MGVDMTAILVPLLVALGCFVLLWPLSLWRRDASLVDALWGPGFLIQLLVAAWILGELTPHGWLLVGTVGIWSIRLGIVLGGRRLREGHEDPRYQVIRESWGPAFWWKSLFIVFILQALVQWVVAIGPLSGMLAPDQPLGLLAWAGLVVAMAGLSVEAIADRQLDRFKRTAGKGQLLTTGLRAHIRHPNYLGEMVFWAGIAMIALDAGAWAGLISPIVITLFLTKVSGVPMLDEHLSRSRPQYAVYKKRTPALLPTLRAQQLR